jgi:TonB-linked SusC/RagA family outer membrane protein
VINDFTSLGNNLRCRALLAFCVAFTVQTVPSIAQSAGIGTTAHNTQSQQLVVSAVSDGAPSSDTSAFATRVSVNFERTSLDVAIRAIASVGGFTVNCIDCAIPDVQVSYAITSAPALAVLRTILARSGLEVMIASARQVVLHAQAVGRGSAKQVQASGLTGRVTDSATGAPIDQAVVRVEESGVATTSSPDGKYRLIIRPGSYVVSFRRLGYRALSLHFTIGDSLTTKNVALSLSPATLDEVVTTVPGDRSRYELGNLIETIRADSITAHSAVSSLTDVLNGRVSGAQVFTMGGWTGVSPDVNIRGQNSFALSNLPLLYVDGVRVENSTSIEPSLGATRAPTTGRFNDIDPQDIESIQFVKGPSAATLYGTDAANGVILITTKQGHSLAPAWNLYGETGLLTVDKGRLVDPYYSWGHTTGPAPTATECPLLSQASGACTIDSVTHFNPLRSPTLTTLGTGYRDVAGFDVSGTLSGSRYFVGARYEDEVAPTEMPAVDRQILAAEQGATGLQAANIRPNGVYRIPLRANLVAPVARTADLTLSVSVLNENARIDPGNDWASALNGSGRRDSLDGWNSYFGRPAEIFAQRQLESVVHLTAGTTASWRPSTWLSAHATGGYDFSYDALDELTPANETSLDPGGDRAIGKTDVSQITTDVGATGSFNLTPWLLSRTAVGGQYNARVENDDQSSVSPIGIGTTTLAGGTTAPFVTEAEFETKTIGAYAQEELGIRQRLYITFALRADGAGAFGRYYNAAIYPKASASWLLSEEPFFPSNHIVNSIRLRAAYGQSGVQPGPTASLRTLTQQPVYVDGVTTTGAFLNTVGNPNLQPERQEELEAGVDLGVASDRIQIQATYYHKRSSDALVSLPDAPQLGSYSEFLNGSTQYNVGSVLNYGIELSAAVTILDTRSARWDMSLNGSVNRNTLLKIAPGMDSIAYGNLHVGYPIFSDFELPILSYKDLNHDGIIEPNEVVVGSNSAFRGQLYPGAQWSVGTTLSLFNRKVQLSAMLDRRGEFVEPVTQRSQDFQGVGQAVNDPHAPLQEQAAYVAFQKAFTQWGYFQSGDFTRLREVSVSYTLPPIAARSVHAKFATLTLAARNVALWTRYRGIDPEANSGGDAGVPSNKGGGPGAYNPAATGGPIPNQYWILRVRLGL